MTEFNIDDIKERIDKLEEVKKSLKSQFIGIDSIIDEFIKNIYIWYVMPEILNRPIIVNLWGMTGVGKTDLIRKFVKEIKFNNKFIEIQMDCDDNNYSGSARIQYHLENILEDTDATGVLLLDEMQRFRSIDEKGMEIRNHSKYSDLWMLLSDGKFESDSKNRNELMEILLDDYYSMDQYEEEPESENEVSSPNESVKKKKNAKDRKYKTWTWTARRLKKLLKLSESIEEIMMWDIDKKISIIKDKLADNNLFEGKVYSKLLIIVSGNLDEAYEMSDAVDDVDLDADIFHEFAKGINILKIKDALTQRFKPEQIARFGNTHIIYPAFSKQNYIDIIKLKLNNIVDFIKDKHQIQIKYSPQLIQFIYDNGVFPTQGVRPVLSTIASVFENSLPVFIYNAVLENINQFYIECNNKQLTSDIGTKKVEYDIHAVISSIRDKKDINLLSLVAIHEAAHAMCYSLLFGYAPLQLICRTAADDVEGFSAHNRIRASKQYLKNQITILMAGTCAEELYFSEHKVSAGASGDIRKATQLAANYIRKYGFAQYTSFIVSDKTDEHSHLNQNISITNEIIEVILRECKAIAKNILTENGKLLKAIAKQLLTNKKLSQEQYCEIFTEFNKDIKIIPGDKELIENYNELLTDKIS